MKLAGTVILYYPDIDLLNRIKTYIDIVDVLFVVDNTETNHQELKEILLNEEKVVYLHDGINKGIAERLNQISELAIQEGYNLLLTMDQDSFFNPKIAINYKTCIINYNISLIAMMGLEFIESTAIIEQDCQVKNVTELITSGSILNLAHFKAIGGFDKKLFIDYVDHEYCYRAILKGFGIVKFTNIFLQHKIGELSKKRSLASLKYTERSFHSSIRIYYMVRNYLYVKSKYFTAFPKELKIQQKSILVRIKNKFLYNRSRWTLLKLIFKGYGDYKKGKMGKLEL